MALPGDCGSEIDIGRLWSTGCWKRRQRPHHPKTPMTLRLRKNQSRHCLAAKPPTNRNSSSWRWQVWGGLGSTATSLRSPVMTAQLHCFDAAKRPRPRRRRAAGSRPLKPRRPPRPYPGEGHRNFGCEITADCTGEVAIVASCQTRPFPGCGRSIATEPCAVGDQGRVGHGHASS